MNLDAQMHTCTHDPTHAEPGNTNIDTNGSRARAWSLTMNNPAVQDFSGIEKILLDENIRDLIIQGEIGNANNTFHLQGCIYFKQPKTFKHVKSLFNRAHIERCRNYKALSKYCCKDDTWDQTNRIIYKNNAYITKLGFEDIPIFQESPKLSYYDWIENQANQLEADFSNGNFKNFTENIKYETYNSLSPP